LNGGTLTLGGGTISGIEAITLVRGSEFADDLRVGPGVDGVRELAGAGGDDRLAAGASGTTLRGEDGDDLLIGSRGGDFIYGGQGNDTASYANAVDSVVVRLDADGENSFGGGGNDVFNSIENVIGSSFDDVIEGDEFDNRLTGAQGVDHLFGGAGDDHLIGGDQADRMEGGLGDDFYSVLSGGDLVIEEPGAGYDIVFAAVNHSLAEGVEQLRLGGSAGRGDGNRLDNLIIGNDNGELLYGHVGKDELRGGDGNDRLNGGRGIDLLIGGAGADQFRFEEGDTRDSRATADVVEDLSRADRDRINLRAIDADESTPGTNENFSFIGTSAFSGQAGELRYDTVDGHRYVYGDTDGDAAADLVIRVDGLEPLRASDFVL
jgi:Ca2+-binding RTX toxin-like protein